MLQDCKNSRKQGDIGLGAAIAYFTANHFTVSIPLTDNQEYDLVIDRNDGLKKVQVKTSKHKKDSGSYEVMLKTMGGNKSGRTVKMFDPIAVDYLFILTDEGIKYLIPTDAETNKATITLGQKYDQYRV